MIYVVKEQSLHLPDCRYVVTAKTLMEFSTVEGLRMWARSRKPRLKICGLCDRRLDDAVSVQ